MLGEIVTVEQRSPDWHRLRLGLLTGSRAGDMLATLKSGSEAATRRQLRIQLACERLTGRSAGERYQSRDMLRGTATEPIALAAYEAATGRLVERVGFVKHPTLAAGCSPDGIADDGIIEIKCPTPATHFGYWLAPTVVPADYLGQIIHNLWITGAAWCDFVSYDDRFPAGLQLLIVRHARAATEIASYEFMARRFLDDVDKQVAALHAVMVAA